MESILLAGLDAPSAGVLAGAAGAVSTLGSYILSSWLSPQLFRCYSSLKGRDKQDWDSKLPHIVHAIASACLVMLTILLCPEFFPANATPFDPLPSTSSDPLKPPILSATSPLSIACLSFSSGYFLADLLLMTQTSFNLVMLLHHIAGLGALAATLSSSSCHLYGLLLLSTEVTTPFICLRWYLDKAKMRGTRVYLANGICIFIGWLFARIILFTFLYKHMWDHREELSRQVTYVQVIAPGITVILSILNIFWFSKICAGVRNAVLPRVKTS